MHVNNFRALFLLEHFFLVFLVPCQIGHSDYGAFAAKLVEVGAPPILPRKGRHDDQSHPPIHPTKVFFIFTSAPSVLLMVHRKKGA
ncbi:hypothetical protein Zmor_004332 [Zophobas morio]|uniref:Secreted protein n=1 Tax=Zophobas morio TaxID=2755281 RepID=A0AA38HLQ5_9CUCU|nr:hypothetical protein Zmor_004332 [Zophobas morio]